jgi:Outer membrane protein beta-barrel domain
VKSSRVILSVLLALAAAVAAPDLAEAQALGLGPRLSFVRPDDSGSVDRTRFVGGIARLGLSKRVALEGAADFRSEQSDDGLTRIKERPLQGSVVLFLARARIAPYVLGGYGIYSRTIETFLDDQPGSPVSSASERRTGAHFGLGAELLLGRHAAFLVDYRYRFVRFGVADEGAGEGQVNLPGLGDRLAHQGAMWTSGVAFYF